MYTQCPECLTAFRVTAEVLKQAAGKVRCGGCGAAFNALDFLSEQKPGPRPRPKSAPKLPELKPEQPAKSAGPVPPARAEQTAILETLDRIAGSDVRIEDTGVEWRVYDAEDETGEDLAEEDAASKTGSAQWYFEDAPGEPRDMPEVFDRPGQTPIDAELSGDAEEGVIDEMLESSPTPVDEILSDEPGGVDSGEIFGAPRQPAVRSESEMRFDDNTPLPEDYPESPEPPAGRTEEPAAPPRQPAPDEAQIDLALGDPDEWEALLEEFEEAAADAGPEALGAAVADEESPGMSLAEELASLPDPDDPENGSATGLEFELELELEASAAEPVGEESGERPPDDERTMDRLIDEDLLALAGDEESASTATVARDPDEDEEEARLVETIIMEGESIRAYEDDEPPADEEPAPDEPSFLPVPVRQDTAARSRRGRLGAGLGIALLALLLAGQVLHQSREALATIPAVNDAIAPVYRMLGRPITPAWDVTGWRFEVTRGSTDGSGQALTIVSRIGNASGSALPYPLISVSLTDRFDDVIGSEVLEPAEYLPEGTDTRRLVAPGVDFDAAMTIRSPSPEASGFKLNVCYREAGGALRCAVQAFR